jgi:RNA polymerase sigma-70 factor, ECF subfamily
MAHSQRNEVPVSVAATTRAPSSRSQPLVEHLGLHLDPERADDLLRAAGRGDRTAFGTLLDRTAPVILGALRRVLNDRSEAERITGEVYVRLWRTAPRFGPGSGSAHARLVQLTRCELISSARLR